MTNIITPKAVLTLTIHPPERGSIDIAPLKVPKTIISVPMPIAKTNSTTVPKMTLPCVPTYASVAPKAGAVHGPTTNPETAPTRTADT